MLRLEGCDRAGADGLEWEEIDMNSPKPKLTGRQEEILRAARGAKSIEVDGKSLRPVETLKHHKLVRFTRQHVEGPTAAGHERVIVEITSEGRRWFCKRAP